MTTRWVPVALLLALVVTGCGDNRTTASRLRDDTAAVVEAINAKNATAARHALDVLDADLSAAGRLDQLDADTVTALRAGVTQLRADLALITPRAPVTPTTPPRVTETRKGGKKHKGDD